MVFLVVVLVVDGGGQNDCQMKHFSAPWYLRFLHFRSAKSIWRSLFTGGFSVLAIFFEIVLVPSESGSIVRCRGRKSAGVVF